MLMATWQCSGDQETGTVTFRTPPRCTDGGPPQNLDHGHRDSEPFVNRGIPNTQFRPSSSPHRRLALPTAKGDSAHIDVAVSSYSASKKRQPLLADQPERPPAMSIPNPNIGASALAEERLVNLKSELGLNIQAINVSTDAVSHKFNANKGSTTASIHSVASKQELVPVSSCPLDVMARTRNLDDKISMEVEASISNFKSCHDRPGRKLTARSVALSIEGMLLRLIRRKPEDEFLVENITSALHPRSSREFARSNKVGNGRRNEMLPEGEALHTSTVTVAPNTKTRNVRDIPLAPIIASGSMSAQRDVPVSISYTQDRKNSQALTGTSDLTGGTPLPSVPQVYFANRSSQRRSYISALKPTYKHISRGHIRYTSTSNIACCVSANKAVVENPLIDNAQKISPREPEENLLVAKKVTNTGHNTISERSRPGSKAIKPEVKAKPIRTMQPHVNQETIVKGDTHDGSDGLEHPIVPVKKRSQTEPVANSSRIPGPEYGNVVAFADISPRRPPQVTFAWKRPRKKVNLYRFHHPAWSTDALTKDSEVAPLEPDHGSQVDKPFEAPVNTSAEDESSPVHLIRLPVSAQSLKSVEDPETHPNGAAARAPDIECTMESLHAGNHSSVRAIVVTSNRDSITPAIPVSTLDSHKAFASFPETPFPPAKSGECVGTTEKGNYKTQTLTGVGGIAPPGTDIPKSPLLPTPVMTHSLQARHAEQEEGSAEELICGLSCCLLLILLLLSLLLFLFLHVSFEPRPTSSTVHTTGTLPTTAPALTVYYCTTAFCSREGEYIKSLLSTTHEPCDNFYGYVCEAWSKQNPHDASGVGSVVSSDTLLEDVIAKHTLPFLVSTTEKDVKLASDLFQECSDRSKTGSSIISAREVLRRWTIRDWPRMGSRSTMNEVWTLAGELIRDLGIGGILTVTIGVDPDFLDRTIVELSEPELIFFRGDETQQQLVALFRGAIKEIATGFGVEVVSQEILASDVMMVFERIAYAVESVNIKGRSRGPPVLKVIELDGGIRTLLDIVFLNVTRMSLSQTVVLKSPRFIQYGLPRTLRNLHPGSILNYLGFLALVRLAPFFPEKLRDLRQLFSKSVLGRASNDVTDTPSLCLRAVDKVLPSCLSKAYTQFSLSAGTSGMTRQWISQLERVFEKQISKLYWVDELSALLVRYRMKTWQLVRFFPYSDTDTCSPDDRTPAVNPLHFYHRISMLHQQQEIQNILKRGDLRGWGQAQSIFSTRPVYDPARQVVYVPAGLVNSSVPTASTLFTFHLARAAVRVYRALAEILFDENVYVRDSPLRFTEESHKRLDDLLDCFERDIRQLPRDLGPGSLLMDTSSVRRAALAQTVALHLAFRAFRELLHARRIWHLDFRFRTLPTVSADKLFFLYFALDNCESGDSVYRFDSARSRLPAEHLVNVPLRHMPEFTKLFSCKSGSSMVVPKIAVCEVAKPVQVRRFRSRSKVLNASRSSVRNAIM